MGYVTFISTAIAHREADSLKKKTENFAATVIFQEVEVKFVITITKVT